MDLKVIYKDRKYQVLMDGVDIGKKVSGIEFDPMKPDIPPKITLEMWVSSFEFDGEVEQTEVYQSEVPKRALEFINDDSKKD